MSDISDSSHTTLSPSTLTKRNYVALCQTSPRGEIFVAFRYTSQSKFSHNNRIVIQEITNGRKQNLGSISVASRSRQWTQAANLNEQRANREARRDGKRIQLDLRIENKAAALVTVMNFPKVFVLINDP